MRALEVYLLTGQPLTSHFAATASPIAGFRILPLGVVLPRPDLRARVSRRVDEQFNRGVVAEVREIIASGVPDSEHALSGLVYRQVVEMLRGVRDEPATRELIVRENMRYARRQLIWFRKEAEVQWIPGAGESASVQEQALSLARSFVNL